MTSSICQLWISIHNWLVLLEKAKKFDQSVFTNQTKNTWLTNSSSVDSDVDFSFFFDTTKLFVIILLFLMNSFLNNTAIASQQTWALVYHILIHPGMIQIQMLRLVFHYVKMWFSDYGLTHCSYQKPFNLFLFFYSYNFKRLWI